MLVEHFHFTEVGFADPLKRGCMEMFDLTEDQVYKNKAELDPFWAVTPREILQKSFHFHLFLVSQ